MPPPSSSARSPLAIVFLIIFLDMLGIGILIPVIPQLLANPDSQFFLLPPGWTLDQGYLLLGALIAVFPMMQFVFTPILGELSDKFGRKPILQISLAGTCASYVVFALGIYLRHLPILFVARALDGATGGNIAVAQAAISDSTPPEHRAKNFGLIGAAFGLGFILGPYIGGKLSDPSVVSWFDAATPFWFAAALSLANIVVVRLRFAETLKVTQPDKRIDWRRSAKNINHAWRLAPLRSLFLTNFLYQFGFSSFTTFSSVFFIARFGFTQGHLGDFYAYLGLWIVFSQAVITRQVSKRVAESKVLRVSLVAGGLSVLLYFVPTAAWGLLVVAPVFAAFSGLNQSNLMGLLSRSAGPHIQGEILGINASVQALAQTMPPLLSGVVAGRAGPGAPLIVSTASIIGAAVCFALLFKPPQMPVE